MTRDIDSDCPKCGYNHWAWTQDIDSSCDEVELTVMGE